MSPAVTWVQPASPSKLPLTIISRQPVGSVSTGGGVVGPGVGRVDPSGSGGGVGAEPGPVVPPATLIPTCPKAVLTASAACWSYRSVAACTVARAASRKSDSGDRY